MSTIAEAAETAWHRSPTGDTSTAAARHAWRALRTLEEVAPRTWFYSGFANVVVRKTDDGLIVIDPGAFNNAPEKQAAVREQFPVSDVSNRVNTIVYTHGHVDHCFGAPLYVAEAEEHGAPAPVVVGHEVIAWRFARYRETIGFNGIINLRQFRGGQGTPFWPDEYSPPTVTYRDRMTLVGGGVSLELTYARGETDDASWLFCPDTKVLCTGDLFVWVAPNCGNPQKTQRFCLEWAQALQEMASLDAEVLLPGHGTPIFGAARVRQALTETATYLASIHDQTLAFMNQGLPLDTIVQQVRPPAELRDRPYLQPVYDEPEFMVRNIWRLYGGWYDGIPSHLKPAPEAEQARVIAELAGGADKLGARALVALQAGDSRLAGHLADWAHFAAPDDASIRAVRRSVYGVRQEDAGSTMAIGIFRTAAVEMGAEIKGSTFQAST